MTPKTLFLMGASCLTAAVLLCLFCPATSSPAPPDVPTIGAYTPYDTMTNGREFIDKALQKAKESGKKRVLILWGHNQCTDCLDLFDIFKTDGQVIDAWYSSCVLVIVDIGTQEHPRNRDLARQYQADLAQGVPYLTMLDADGRVVADHAAKAFAVSATRDISDSASRALGWFVKAVRNADGPHLDIARVLAFLKLSRSNTPGCKDSDCHTDELVFRDPGGKQPH